MYSLRSSLRWIVVLCTFCALPTFADEPILTVNVHTHQWDEYTNRDGTGLYFDTLRAVFEPEGIQVSYVFVPFEESIRNVQEKTADVALSSYLGGFPDVLYPDWPLEIDLAWGVHRRDLPYSGPESLVGKRVAWVRGYGFDDFLKTDFHKVLVDDEVSGLRQLVDGTVDYFIDFKPTLQSAAETANIDLSPYVFTPFQTLARRVYPAFRADERGKQIRAIYDQRMDELHEEGILSKIFQKYGYQEYPLPPPDF